MSSPFKPNKKRKVSKENIKQSRLNKLVKAIVHGSEEKKYNDVFFQNATTATGTAICNLSEIPAGTDYNVRLGRKIKLMSVQVHVQYQLSMNPTIGSGTCGSFTMWIVLDRQPNGTAAAFTDILTLGAFSGSQFGLAFKNVATNSLRFKILKEVHFPNCDSGVGTATSGGTVCSTPVGNHKFFVKLPEGEDSISDYTSTTALVPATNAIYVVLGTNDSGGGSDTVSIINLATRLTYVDM